MRYNASLNLWPNKERRAACDGRMNPGSVKVRQEMHYYSIRLDRSRFSCRYKTPKKSKAYTFLRSYHVICDVFKRQVLQVGNRKIQGGLNWENGIKP